MKKVFWKHNRGLSTYGDKLFIATWDGRLIAINRKDGKEVWQTRTFDHDQPLNITGHPKAFDARYSSAMAEPNLARCVGM